MSDEPLTTDAPPRTRIKICGITSVELANVAVDAGADFIGLVHVPDSPRCITADIAVEIARSVPISVKVVSVFANQPLDFVAANATEVIQLHGNEDEDYILQLRTLLKNARIIRGFAFDKSAVLRWGQCQDVDVLLIDGHSPGSGTLFLHHELASMMPQINTPVMLAGGLNANNVNEAIRAVQPWGVDVSSGVESSRGIKDPSMIRDFCKAARI